MDLLLGIDIGTNATKTLLVSSDGKVLGSNRNGTGSS